MTKDMVTNKQLYELAQSIDNKLDTLVEKRITPLERAVDRIWIYGSLAIALGGVLADLLITWIKTRMHF